LYYTASGIITPVGGRPVHRLRCTVRKQKNQSMYVDDSLSAEIDRSAGKPTPLIKKHSSVGDMYMAVLSTVFHLAQYSILGHNLRHESFVGNWMLSLMLHLHTSVRQTFRVSLFTLFIYVH